MDFANRQQEEYVGSELEQRNHCKARVSLFVFTLTPNLSFDRPCRRPESRQNYGLFYSPSMSKSLKPFHNEMICGRKECDIKYFDETLQDTKHLI